MKKALVDLVKRIYDLLMKLISIKGAFAIVMTIIALHGGIETYFAFAAWVLFVLGREWFKTILEWKKPKDGDK